MTQLVIRYHRVTVQIENQVAVTHVDQVFFNPNDWPVEGVYMFPIPLDAVVSDFILWVDGKPVEGEILDAEQARQTYEDIVSSLRDPALLEYAGQGAVRASIFPIPPQGERRIELEYSQVLAAEGGLVRYIYPLSTEKFSASPLEQVSINVQIESDVPIRAVYSPSHPVAISREEGAALRVGYEAQDVLPDTDFALYYSIGEDQAFHLFTYRNPFELNDLDGFFLLLLAPGIQQTDQVVAKDILLVLDRSGSMDGEKYRQAQQALEYILDNLNPDDRFNLITFSTGVEVFAPGLRNASKSEEALDWVNDLPAEGSTDINRALLEAVSFVEPGRPTYLIFLTDGLPTTGVVESNQILENLLSAVPANLSLFAFGVGYDVDTFLLDSLAQAHHGSSTYVLPDERLDETLSTFYAKVQTPVLTNLELEIEDSNAYDVFPEPLPDLFAGSQIVIVGRYRQGGYSDITISGNVDGDEQVFQYPEQLFAETSTGQKGVIETLPRLWATRKIGYLLNQVRLNGADQETIEQIVRLSIRYGIVTPYTSYLVSEPMLLGNSQQERIASEQFDQLQAAPAAPSFGEEAVEKAARQGALAGAESAEALPPGAIQRVRVVGARTFVYQAEIWTDTTFDPETMQTQKVTFLSAEYFALARTNPDIASAFALGQAVVVVINGSAIEVVPSSDLNESISRPLENTQEPVIVDPIASPGDTESPIPESNSTSGSRSPCWNGLLPLIPLSIILLKVWRRKSP
jgi:Ca-activated chloride channel family protein